MASLSKRIYWIVSLILAYSALVFPTTALAEVLNNWIGVSLLPSTIANQPAYSKGVDIFSFGGSTTILYSSIYKSSLTTGGDLSGWIASSSIPTPTYYHSLATWNSEVYLLGGTNYPPQASTNPVYVSSQDVSGNFTVWTSLNPLPARLSQGAAVAANGYLYFSGGFTDVESAGSASNKVYYAQILGDGTIGAWGETTTIPSGSTWGHAMVEYNGALYIIGGIDGDGDSNKVYKAVINPDGTLGSWVAQTSLPVASRRGGVIRVEDYILVIGGYENGIFHKENYYAQINSSGNITSWTKSASDYPFGYCCGAAVEAGGYLYVIGGYLSPGGYTNKVYKNQLNIIQPTPTPTPTNKVIIIPGMGASWNADALLNCKSDGYNGGWSMSSFAADIYEPLILALNEAGINVSVFNYDWRREISNNQSGLRNFIDGLGGRFSLVGHSMGGLLGRAYLESSGSDNKLTDLITVGSPHRGSALAYPTWSGGEIWSNDLLTKMVTTLLLKRCDSTEITDRQVVQTYWPSVQNLLPIDDYLRDKTNGNMKPVDSMAARNNWQPTNFQAYGVRVGTLSGIGIDTLQKIPVKNRSRKDAVLGDWEDGKPTGKEMTSQGDGVVLASNSSLPGSENRLVNGTHLGIVSSPEGINQILDLLGITASTSQVVWQEPKSALVVIGNDARLILTDSKGKSRFDSNGMISIINPLPGKYKYVLAPKKSQSELIVIRVKDNGDVLYNEYKFKNLLPKAGVVDF